MRSLDDNIRALRREWLAARIVAPVAALLMLGALAYPIVFGLPATPAASADLDSAADTQSAPAEQQAGTPDPKAGATICRTAVAGAQNFGVLPAAAQPSGEGQPKPESLRGRYDCAVTAGGAEYRIAVDLICSQFDSQECVALYSVTDSKNAVLYRRQQ